MVLFAHNRYRTTGGEERSVQRLLWLARERLGERAELLERDSLRSGRGQAAAGLLWGGLRPAEVHEAVRRTGATVVHAHNVNPLLGWRALAAARSAGAAVVLHLHNYRLVCAVGTCFTEGEDCVRCHGRDTLPGVVHRCRGSVAEAAVYAASLAAWQRRLVAAADAFVVPSRFAAERLRALGAPLDPGRVHVLAPVLPQLETGPPAAPAAPVGPALFAGRLAPEKGADVAIEACRRAGVPLVIAGDGPEERALRERARGLDVRFAGRLDDAAMAGVRSEAGVAVVPSRAAETFGLAAAEAMADGVPVVASRIGALAELVEADGLVAAGDPAELAAAIVRRRGDERAAQRARGTVEGLCAPQTLAPALAKIYEAARASARQRDH